jgi:hypothetical protein
LVTGASSIHWRSLFWSPSRTAQRWAVFLGGSLQFQSRQAQQVVGARHEVGYGLRPFQAQIAAAPQPADRFDPAKNLFNSFSHPLTGLIAGLVDRAPIQPFQPSAFPEAT